jgi:hypothetical protein
MHYFSDRISEDAILIESTPGCLITIQRNLCSDRGTADSAGDDDTSLKWTRLPTQDLSHVMDEGPEDRIAIRTVKDRFKKPRVIVYWPEPQEPTNRVDRREGLCGDQAVFGQFRLLDQAHPQ